MARNTLVTPDNQASEQEHSAIAVSSGGAANQNTARNIGLITAREYKNRVTQRSFIISTVVILILVVLAAFAPTIIQLIASKSSSQTKLAVVNNASTVAGLNSNTLNNYVTSNLNGSTTGQASGQAHFAISSGTPDAIADLQQRVKNGSLSILLVLTRAANQDLQFTYYTNASSTNDTNLSQVQALAEQLSVLDKSSRLGLTLTQTSSLFAQPTFTVVNTAQNQDTRSEADKIAAYFIAYAGIILIFMTVYMYGIGVAMGVAEEKGTRIMEILVNAATPFQLMAGKIIGIGAAGLTQMACIVAVGITALLAQTPIKNALLGTSDGGININITGTSITLLLLLLVYFLLGYLLYSTLFAAFGALVKRQDEVQNAIQPLTWLFMIGYFVSFFGISNPDATWIKVISFIPFWTPTTMLMRIGASVVPWWEIVLSIVIMIIAIIVCALISARIYRAAILMYGQKPGLGQLAKLVRMK